MGDTEPAIQQLRLALSEDKIDYYQAARIGARMKSLQIEQNSAAKERR